MGERRLPEEFRSAPGTPHDHDRTLWVIAVLAFWVSAGITLVVLLITGRLHLILVTITLGMMVLGVWLKARYQLRQRQAHGRTSRGRSE